MSSCVPHPDCASPCSAAHLEKNESCATHLRVPVLARIKTSLSRHLIPLSETSCWVYHNLLLFSFPSSFASDLSQISREALKVSQPCFNKSPRHHGSRQFLYRWKALSDTLNAQWQVVNQVSTVFIGALATMLQDPIVSASLLARSVCMVALICSLASLSLGIVGHVYIGKIKTLTQALSWAKEASDLDAYRWWNASTILSLPIVWLLWSAIFFALTILVAYVCNGISYPGILLQCIIGSVMVVSTVQSLLVIGTLRLIARKTNPDLDVEDELELQYTLDHCLKSQEEGSV